LISGLLRRSFLTARNDDVPFYFHVSFHCISPHRHCEVRSNPENIWKIKIPHFTIEWRQHLLSARKNAHLAGQSKRSHSQKFVEVFPIALNRWEYRPLCRAGV